MKIVSAFIIVLLTASASLAQNPIPIRYRLTRSAPGQSLVIETFLKASMTCNLPSGVPAPGSIRIDDPVNAGRDCEKADPAFFVNMVREVAYNYTIAGQANDIDPYSQESNALTITLPRIPQIPNAPGNLRGVPPNTQGVASLGTINDHPYKFGGLEVAPITLDAGAGNVFLGAERLQVPGYSVRRGDRISLVVWHP
jgi:hypothetical protein